MARDERFDLPLQRVGGSGRGRGPRIALVAWAAGFAALVFVAAMTGRLSTRSASGDASQAIAAALPVPTRHVTSPPTTGSPDTPELIRLDLRRIGNLLFVHAEVYSLQVVNVRVSLRDARGAVTTSESVRMPGGSTALRIGANIRFDVTFPIREGTSGLLRVDADAYDSGGRRLTTSSIPFDTGLSYRFWGE